MVQNQQFKGGEAGTRGTRGTRVYKTRVRVPCIADRLVPVSILKLRLEFRLKLCLELREIFLFFERGVSMEFLTGEIRTARKRLSEIHALMQRTYLDAERRALREEERDLYSRIDLAEREIRAKNEQAQEVLGI